MELKELSKKKSKPYKFYSMGEFQKKHNINQYALQYAVKAGKVDYFRVGSYHVIVGTKLTMGYKPVHYKGAKRCTDIEPPIKKPYVKTEYSKVSRKNTGRRIPVLELFHYDLIRRKQWIADSGGHIGPGIAQVALDKCEIDFIKIGRERLIILSDRTKGYRVNK
jgi:hypothetical protein